MATTWIVAADESRARVLQVLDREQRLAEVEDLVNPAGRMQDRELGKEVEKLVAGELPKDLSWFNARDIERYFRNA